MKNNVRSLLLIAFFTFTSYLLMSQEIKFNQVITDPRLNEQILYGYCDRAGLKGEIFDEVYNDYYKIYEPDKNILAQIRPMLDSVTILIVMGTWCSDSQEQVPKFLKILDKVRFSDKNLTIVCVSKDKEAGNIDLKKYDIQLVPTFIVFRGGREIGRIIESPMMTLEKDLLMLLGD